MNNPMTINVVFALTGWLLSQCTAQSTLPTFRAETIDSQVIIGYGTAIGDVDGDGKPDVLLADKKQFVWYQNPDWKRHVIAENLTKRDNVCIAARDIDGDGKVEIAVGGEWNPNDTVHSGSVHYLVAPKDRTQKWKPIQLTNEPVVHRMRWLKTGDNKFGLVVAPLHGRGNKGGQGKGVQLLLYHIPDDLNLPWPTDVLDDQFHVTHNFDIGMPEQGNNSEVIFYLGREGAKLIAHDGNRWKRKMLQHVKGGGEIRCGRLADDSFFLTTIEPFHGTQLVLYQTENQSGSDRQTSFPTSFPNRLILDNEFNQGHAIAVGDLFGNGEQQIVAGWRSPNAKRKFGVKLYYQNDDPTPNWVSMIVDDNEMACEDLRIGDLNGDGRLDIVAAGRSTHNLKIYWNEPPNQ